MDELVFLELGSNIQPKRNLVKAARLLKDRMNVIRFSNAYQTAPIGPNRQAPFVNAAALLTVTVEPLSLRQALRDIEAELGRVRTGDTFVARPIDLDVVLFGDRIIEETPLIIPDPHLLERDYLALITSELEPEFIHPVTGETLESISARLGTANVVAFDKETTAGLQEAVDQANPS